jgi:hypothetical protein
MNSKDAISMFEELGYTYYSDCECHDFYNNPTTLTTIEIRKYINEYVKYNTGDRKERRGITGEEHLAITKALKELGYIKEENNL